MVAALNALGWRANLLYVACLVVDLRVGPARYGLALGLWGGAGLVSGSLLGRVPTDALARLAVPRLMAMAVAWALMTAALDTRRSPCSACRSGSHRGFSST